ncbi:MAG: RNA polymerase sigma factor, partial [Myxococcales bacterium]|nr:RNA polymerase sigma factor [Myxococcales bacterium]
NDKELLRAWQDGDQAAGGRLLSRFHPSIKRFFDSKQLGAAGDDLVQETFVGLLQADFRGESSVRTFLFAIARNKLLDHLWRLRRDRERFDPSCTSLADIDVETPTGMRARRDQDKLLLAALRTLPIDTQLMIELHYWEEMPYKEIVEVLGMPEGTIKSTVHRARKTLEKRITELAESKEQLESTRQGLQRWAERLRDETP